MKKLVPFLLCCVFSHAFAQSDLPPTISGTPSATAEVGKLYSFKPVAIDPEGKTLRFVIQNRPSWATFSYQTGAISGTPKEIHVGTYSKIRIFAKDAHNTVGTKEFKIVVPVPTPVPSTSMLQVYTCTEVGADGRILESDTVTWPNCKSTSFQDPTKSLVVAVNTGAKPFYWRLASKADGRIWTKIDNTQAWTRPEDITWLTAPSTATGYVTLSWTPPTENTDGTAVKDLAGYRVLYGTSPITLDKQVTIANPGITTYAVEGLTAATYYFAVRAYTTSGAESANSNIASKTIP